MHFKQLILSQAFNIISSMITFQLTKMNFSINLAFMHQNIALKCKIFIHLSFFLKTSNRISI